MAFNHNDHYHRLVLRQVPRGAARALDVGCGTGDFARRLAIDGIAVDAIDADQRMVDLATETPAPGVTFRRTDVGATALPEARYDFISCLASIHHVPFDTVTRLRAALKPGGVLAILGCYRRGQRMSAPVAQAMSTLAEIRSGAAELLPGRTVRMLLFWRYLLVFHQS